MYTCNTDIPKNKNINSSNILMMFQKEMKKQTELVCHVFKARYWGTQKRKNFAGCLVLLTFLLLSFQSSDSLQSLICVSFYVRSTLYYEVHPPCQPSMALEVLVAIITQ